MEKQLIIRFLQNKCTSEEGKRVIDWMNSSNYEPDLMRQIEEDLQNPEGQLAYDKNLDQVFSHIMLRNELDQFESSRSLTRTKNQNRTSSRLLWLAASVLIGFITGYILYLNYSPQPTESLVQQVQHVVKENGYGRKSTIFLPDGSKVNLNSGSRIEYPEHFSETNRVVVLQGEAFFEVVRDTLRPFQVICDNLKVTALGTSFNISSYLEENQISIALATGKVKIEENIAHSHVLEPGKMIRYIKTSGTFDDPEIFNPRLIYGWKDGLLQFQSAGFSTVIPKLERWYGVEFIFEGKQDGLWSYTGEFHDQTLKSVMESLSFSQGFEYKIENKKVYLKF